MGKKKRTDGCRDLTDSSSKISSVGKALSLPLLNNAFLFLSSRVVVRLGESAVVLPALVPSSGEG